jgi:hypothetical protein
LHLRQRALGFGEGQQMYEGHCDKRAWGTAIHRKAYSFTRESEAFHPDNRHVRDKIRQQLQVLRDAELLLHVERGR